MAKKKVMSWDEMTLKELKEKSNYGIEYAYEIGKMTGRRETLDKAYAWLKEQGTTDEWNDFVSRFEMAMED